MSKLAAVNTERRIARPLKVLIPLIQAELQAGNTAGLEHYRRVGEYLLEVRDSGQVAAFQWGTWLSKNFALSRTTAYEYMRLAEVADADPTLVRRGGHSFKEAIGGSTTDHARTTWKRTMAAAARIIERDRDVAKKPTSTRTREDENRAHRELAVELIEIGYRALATRLHPDTGGSKDAMRRLNRVRDELKSLASTRRFV